MPADGGLTAHLGAGRGFAARQALAPVLRKLRWRLFPDAVGIPSPVLLPEVNYFIVVYFNQY